MAADNNICRDHSGICATLTDLKVSVGNKFKDVDKENQKQWMEINSMKKLLLGTLVSIILCLFGLIGNFVLNVSSEEKNEQTLVQIEYLINKLDRISRGHP